MDYLSIGSERLLATLYLPAGRGPFAGLVEVHGGAWVHGDRLNNEFLDRSLAERGIAVLAIDFRLPPEARYPDPVADINFALRWMKANGPRWGIPPERVGVLGTSSGGHQALLATMRPFDPRYLAHAAPPAWDGDVDASVRCTVLCWAVTDPVGRLAMARDQGIERLVEAHALYWPSEAAMDEGSPQAILERKEEVRLSPTLVIQGTKDDNLTPDMADRFASAYRSAGGEIRLEKFEGQPHMFITTDPTGAAAEKAISVIAEFVLRHGSAGGD
ncbi:MAG: alpha/beta hydrolase [Acidimicrobiaceae bacterium]|nr:alpha/beta hydrolase [Acidimicrobiaceae bacterium]